MKNVVASLKNVYDDPMANRGKNFKVNILDTLLYINFMKRYFCHAFINECRYYLIESICIYCFHLQFRRMYFDVGLVCFNRKLMQTGSMKLYDHIFMCFFKIIFLKLNLSLWNMELHILY